jgi:hypothetical protein
LLIRPLAFLLSACALSAATPTVGDASPQSGTAITGHYTFNFTDSAGYQDFGVLNILINNFLDGRQACYLAYSQPQNVLYLVNDAGTAISGMALNGTGTLANSQCIIAGAGSSATGNGNSLTLALNITFQAASFSGARVIYAAARDVAENNSGWQDRGVVFIPPAAPSYPTAASFTPSQGSGSQQTFTVVYRDAANAANLRTGQLLIGSALDGRNGCYLGYDRANNLLYLVADDGGTLLQAVVPGNGVTPGSGSTSNSQCTVSGANSTWSASGTDLILQVGLSFSATFAGAKFAYTGVQTAAGANSGWQAMGFYQVNAPGLVSNIYPTAGAANVPSNSGVIVGFSTPVDPTTLASGITLKQGNTAVAGSVKLATDGVSAVFRPAAQLALGVSYSINAAGVKTNSGGAVPPFASSFTVGTSGSTCCPGSITSTPTGSGAPINSVVQIRNVTPIDPASLGSPALGDSLANASLPLKLQMSPDYLSATLTPPGLLAVGRTYSLNINNATDIFGNSIYFFSSSFTTGFSADTTRPSITGVFPANGATGVSPRVSPIVHFDHPIATASASGVQLTAGGTAVSATFQYPDNQTIVIAPSAVLSTNTTYTFTVPAGVTGLAGAGIGNPQTVSFTTSPTPDPGGFKVVAATPQSSPAGTNSVIRMTFNRPANPLIGMVPGNSYSTPLQGTSKLSADGLVLTFTPTQLAPSSSYTLNLNVFEDSTGSPGQGVSYIQFSTGGGPDTTPPTLRSVTPAGGSAGVPVNAVIAAQYSKPVDATSITTSSGSLVQGGTPVPGSVAVGYDLMTVSFKPTSALLPQTTYTATFTGITDAVGNPAPAASTTFTTAVSGTPDTTRPTVTSVSPANGATNVPITSAVSVTFSEPIGLVTASGVTVSWGSIPLSGSTAVFGNVVTFTPAQPLPTSSILTVAVNGVLDLVGNITASSQATFTTQAGTDTTAPVVTSVTPVDGATGVPSNSVVTLTFSKPLNPSTVNGNVMIFTGSKPANYVYSQVSTDARTVTLFLTGASLQGGAIIVVAATSGVTDLSGNHLVPFQSRFTTTPYNGNAPTVVSQRPANGATGVLPNATVTLVLSQPVSAASLMSGMRVSQNGVLISGTVSVIENGQAVQFTPSLPFSAGALIQVFLDSPSYSGQFTVQGGSPGAFTLTRSTAGSVIVGYGTTILPTNAVLDFEFSQPIDPSTVQAGSIVIRPQYSSTATVNATVTLHTPTVIRVIPSAPLTASSSYYTYFAGTIKSTQGQAYVNTGNLYFTTAGSADNSVVAVSAFGPPNNSTGVGTNTVLRVDFNKVVNPISITPASVQVTAGSTTIPVSLSFLQTNATLYISPQVLLPDSTTIHVNLTGVEGLNGLSLTTSFQFTTGSAIDLTPPVLLATSIQSGATAVPPTAPLSFTFSKPIDPGSLSAASCNISQAGAFSYSPDFTQATFVPSPSWPVGTSANFSCSGIQDFAGNTLSSTGGGYPIQISFSFTVGFLPDATPLQVTAVSPSATFTGAPLNTQIQVLFTKAVQGTSLGGVTLSAGGSNVPATASVSSELRIVTLSPNAPLAANTNYTVSVASVRDLSGNLLAGPFTSTFTTGSAIDTASPNLVVSPTGTGAGTNAIVRLSYNKVINPLSLLADLALYVGNGGGIYNCPCPGLVKATISVSPDGRTVTLTPAAALLPNTTYTLYLPGTTDLAGNYTSYYQSTYFTTGSAADSTPPTVSAISPPNGASGMPVNTVIRILMSKPLNAGSVAGSVTLLAGSLSVNGAASLLNDGMTITFTPAANLAILTTYTVQVSGITDTTGNTMAPFSSMFTTSGSGTPDTTSLQVNSVSPAQGATGVSVNTTVVVTFNKAISAATVTNSSLVITAYGVKLAGAYTVANGSQAVFTPSGTLPGNATISISANGVTDYSGHTANFTWQFTTAAADNTPPAVTSISPANGATGVSPSAPIVITFSKPLNPSTVNNSNILLSPFSGYPNIVRSDDSMTVTINPFTLSSNTKITVVVTSGVTDLSGNALPNFVSSYTTGNSTTGSNAQAQVVNRQPLPYTQSVSPSTTITINFDRAIDPTSIAGGIFVSQNGVLAAGSLTMPTPTSVLFTPSAPFAAGARVQVFVTANVADTNGVPAYTNSWYFTIAGTPSSQALSVVRTTAVRGPLAPDVVLDVEFNAPVAALSDDGAIGLFQGGAAVRGVVVPRGDRVLRFVPAYAMTADSEYELRVRGAFGGQTFRFRTGREWSETPSLKGQTLGASEIRLEFDAPVNPITATRKTIRVLDAAGEAVAFRIGFTPDDRTIVLYPESAAVRVEIDGVEGLNGERVR